MQKQKWYRNPEMLVALTALFIGLITATISIYSAYIDRAYAKASVWPRVEIFRSHNNESFSYGVSNNGTGPAIIKYAKVSSGDQYLKKWSELPEFKSITQSHIGSITLPSGKTVNPVKYKGELIKEVLTVDQGIEIELCYCSIYGDCWIVDRSNETQPTEACAVSPEQAFRQ